MKKYLNSILLFALLFTACEQPVNEEDVPYDFKIVVSGILNSGKQVKDIYIGRTQPISYKFSEEFSKITDAYPVIEFNNKVYPLTHTGNGLYANDTLFAVAGKKYTLILNYQGKLVTAQTIVPSNGILNKASLVSQNVNEKVEYFVKANLKSRSDEVYASTWVVILPNGLVNSEGNEFYEVVKNNAGNVEVNSTIIPQHIYNGFKENLGVRVHIFDTQFYDYFLTKPSSEITDAIYGSLHTGVKWNIQGDGIGLFIGRSEILKKLQN